MLKALIFDVDGTLADTEMAHLAAFNHAFAEMGLDWQWDVPLYTRLLAVSGGKERIKAYWQTRAQVQEWGQVRVHLLALLVVAKVRAGKQMEKPLVICQWL